MELGKRIMIIGSAGAGKSALARRIGEILGLEVFHLDSLFWRPGWVMPPREEWREKVRALAAGESWIIDGNYGNSLGIRLPRAETILFLDLPRWTCLWSVVIRRMAHCGGKTRPDMAEGCPEKLDWDFLKWIYNFSRDSRPELIKGLASCRPDQQVITLTSRREMRSFLENAGDNCPVRG
jgi:adenylate kinase family enzyme